MNENSDKKQRKREESLEVIRSSRAFHSVVNAVVRSAVYLYIFATPKGWAYLSGREHRQVLFDRKYRTGMLEHSIIWNPLYFPDDQGELQYEKAPGGRWVAYDFHRHKELGKNVANHLQGRLAYFLLDIVLPNSKQTFTPSNTLDFFEIEHILQFESRGIEDLVKHEFVELTTYSQAFKRAGAFEQYAAQLVSTGIEEARVYQVTPKGNGLILICKDGGEKIEKPKEKIVLVPLPA